jgi:hypothetical protein
MRDERREDEKRSMEYGVRRKEKELYRWGCRTIL